MRELSHDSEFNDLTRIPEADNKLLECFLEAFGIWLTMNHLEMLLSRVCSTFKLHSDSADHLFCLRIEIGLPQLSHPEILT